MSALFDYQARPDTTLSFGAGATLGGHLVTESAASERFELQPGWLLAAAYARRLLDGQGSKPFLIFGVSLGVSGASTRARAMPLAPAESFHAVDVRAGLTVGKTFWNVLSPYAAARAFGGPIFWRYGGEARVGTDLYHFTLAAGLVTALPRGFDLFAEVAPVGERAATVGGGKRF